MCLQECTKLSGVEITQEEWISLLISTADVCQSVSLSKCKIEPFFLYHNDLSKHTISIKLLKGKLQALLYTSVTK